jgi:hypothetical protein
MCKTHWYMTSLYPWMRRERENLSTSHTFHQQSRGLIYKATWPCRSPMCVSFITPIWEPHMFQARRSVVITSTHHVWFFSMCRSSATSAWYQPLSYWLRHMSIYNAFISPILFFSLSWFTEGINWEFWTVNKPGHLWEVCNQQITIVKKRTESRPLNKHRIVNTR